MKSPSFPDVFELTNMGPDALVEVVHRHSSALVLYARQWCHSPEDVVQSAFLKLAKQRVPPEKLVPWLYRVVRNAAIDASRAEQRRKKYETRAAERNPEWFEASDDLPGLDVKAVTAALSELPNEYREIMVAHLWGGLTFEEIADLVGGSASTAYRRYASGLNMLRERLRVPCRTVKKT